LNSAMDSNKRVTRPSLSAEIGSGQSLGLHELPRQLVLFYFKRGNERNSTEL